MEDARNHNFWLKHKCNAYCDAEIHADIWYGLPNTPIPKGQRYILDNDSWLPVAEIVSTKEVYEAPANTENPELTQTVLTLFKHLEKL